MKTMVRWAAACCGLALLAAGSPALAHNFWLAPDKHFPQVGETVEIKIGFGHQYPASRVDERVKDGMVAEVVVIAPDGTATPLAMQAVDTCRLKIDRPGVHLLVASMTPGLFSRTPEGMKRGSKRDWPEVVECRDMRMVANAWLVAGGQGGAAPGAPQPLQITPLADLVGLKKGDTLPVLVLFKGRPLVGAKLWATYAGYAPPAAPQPEAQAGSRASHAAPFAQQVVTDEQGRAGIELEAAGYWLVIASHGAPYTPAEVCDKQVHTASFAFEAR